jgi:hypothetical protein
MSAFSNTVSYVGNADFKVIDIDPVEVASALQKYVDRGSKLTGVSLDDINLSVCRLPSDVKKCTLVDLLDIGMPLFDAIVWLTAGRPSTHELTVDNSIVKANLPSMHEIARSVFYTYFFLVTQARYPVPTGGTNSPKVPNFLSVVMGMTGSQSSYIEKICSFPPQKFDPKWAKSIKFENFGQEALSRFGLGVAGYRLFGPFKIYKPMDNISNELKSAIDFARKVSESSPTWDIHPLTRDPAILTKRGNLNKNLGNLILDVFTEEQIDEMVNSKMLFAKPTREPSYKNYLTWSSNDDISGNQLIFRV